MYCTNCGKKNLGSDLFCQKCGANLNLPINNGTGKAASVAAKTQPEVQEQNEKTKIQKPASRLSAKKSQIDPKKPKNRKLKKKAIIILAIAISVITLVVTACVLLFPSNRDKKQMSFTKDWDIVVDAQKPDYTGYVGLYYEQVTFAMEDQFHNDDGTGTAVVTVTTPNMQIVFEEVLNSMQVESSISDEELAEQARNSLEEMLGQDCEKITTTIEVPLQNVGDEWKIVPTDEWNAVITSNMVEILHQYYAQIFEEDLK